MFKKRAMNLHGLTRCGNRTRRSLLVTSRHSQTAGNRRPFGPQLCRAGQLFATCLEALHRRHQRLSVCSETPATSTGKCSFSLVISRTTLANACTSAHAPYMSQASRKSKNPADPDADNRLAPFQCSSNLPGRVHKKKLPVSKYRVRKHAPSDTRDDHSAIQGPGPILQALARSSQLR